MDNTIRSQHSNSNQSNPSPRIAVFYHSLFYFGTPPEFSLTAYKIIGEQMDQMRDSGLLSSISHMTVGINGGNESVPVASTVLPASATLLLHGLDSRTENCTLLALHDFVVQSEQEWYVLYFHSKGATRPDDDPIRTNWRKCMMRNLVTNWRTCVADMDAGFESVGCHWMTGDQTPPGQSVWAGNFWWAKASFLRTLPSMLDRPRIKESGLKNVDSRYESEVWIGNGPRLPVVKDYHPEWISQCKP